MVKVHCQRGVRSPHATGMFGDAAARSCDAAEQLLEHAEPRERFGILVNGGNAAHAARRAARGAPPVRPGRSTTPREDDDPTEAFTALHNLGYARVPRRPTCPTRSGPMDEAGRARPSRSRAGCALLDRARVLGEAGLVQRGRRARSPRAAEIFSARPAGPGPRRDRTRTGPLRADRRARSQAVATLRHARPRPVPAPRQRPLAPRAPNSSLLQGDLAAGRPGRRLTGPALRLRARVRARGRAAAGPDRRAHRGRGAPVRRARSIGDTHAAERPRIDASRPDHDPAACGLCAGTARAGHRMPVGRQPAGPARACRPCGVPGELRQHRSRDRGRGARPSTGRSRSVRRARFRTRRARPRVGRAGPGSGEPAAGGPSARRPRGRAVARRPAADGRSSAAGRPAAPARR